MKVLVLVAPGQGAQTPGFLSPWLDLPGATDQLRAWSGAAGLDLVRYGTEADAEEIRDTAVAQPLLVAAALLSAKALFGDLGQGGAPGDGAYAPGTGYALTGPDDDRLRHLPPGGATAGLAATAPESESYAVPAPWSAVGATAGHSVGELAAAALAGVLAPADALALVRRRALAMAEAAAATETGMSAVLGGDPDEVTTCLEKLGLTVANNNGGGQIVAAGTVQQLADLAANKPDKARVIPLKVAGAFHTHHMAPAVAAVAEAARDVPAADPAIRYVSNADGRVVTEGPEVLRRLVSQVSNPVRWDLCTETFRELGATGLVELCPGGTLTGLAKRSLKGVTTVALKTPNDLAAARELVAAHAAGQGTAG